MEREWLEKYTGLRQETECQLERLARMKSAERMPVQRESDGSQHLGSKGDFMARAVEARIQYEQAARPKIEANLQAMRMVQTAVDSLPDPLEREVLRLRYLDGQFSRPTPWRKVALQLYGDDDDKSMAAIYRLHGKALGHMQQLEM